MEKTITTPQTCLNRVELRGTVGAVKTFPAGGQLYIQLSLATNFAYRDADGCAVIDTTWHNVHAHEGTFVSRDTINSIAKGDKIRVQGRISNRRYVDENGIERMSTVIVASTLEKVEQEEPLQLEM